jgi:hypothetical protein
VQSLNALALNHVDNRSNFLERVSRYFSTTRTRKPVKIRRNRHLNSLSLASHLLELRNSPLWNVFPSGEKFSSRWQPHILPTTQTPYFQRCKCRDL